MNLNDNFIDNSVVAYYFLSHPV